MIRFFRSIRKNLLDNNKFLKYTRYAIGEIFLVVIGILIALQINNWNEDRKRQQRELDILRQMEKELSEDLQFEVENGSIDLALKSSDLIVNHLENNLPYHDSLDFYFANLPVFRLHMPNTSAYDNLKIIGFDIISNDSLREKYQKLFSQLYKFSEFTRNNIDVEKAAKFNDYFLDNFKDLDWSKNATPVDYESLCKDSWFIELVKWNKSENLQRKEIYLWTIKEIKEIIGLIEEEMRAHK